MKTVLILMAVTGATLLGDYFIKIASGKSDGLLSLNFVAGIVLYALPAVGWYFLMKSHSLAVIGVLYSTTTLVLLALLGVFVFNETFGWREGAGITLALAAVLIVGLK